MPPQPETSIWQEGPVTAPRKIYGGVARDGRAGRGWFEEGKPLLGLYVWGVDLPLSAVGDTLTLPFTIRAAIDRGIEDYYFPDKLTDESADSLDIQKASFNETQ